MSLQAPMNRRQFLTQSSCAAIGTTSLLSTLLNMKAVGAISTPGVYSTDQDYKALVCLFLSGGNDSFNMLVPHGQSEYDEYKEIRTDLALERNTLLPLNFTATDGKTFGLHPAMSETKGLFDTGEVALVSNVGTLVEPVTKAQLDSGAQLPLGLFSHSDQIMHWQTSVPDERSRVGFAGRLADLLHASHNTDNLSMNISFSGNNMYNVFQTGDNVTSFNISSYGKAETIHRYGSRNSFHSLKTAAINNIMDATYDDLFRQSYTGMVKSSIASNQFFKETFSQAPDFQTIFSDNRISRCFSTIARIIAMRETLGMKRQTFFIRYGGWDHHDEVINSQNTKLEIVSKALGEFNSALKEIGIADKVTTFTASDFARTLTSNGRGSDHAWGGNHIVMGGAVNGGQIYGTYPSLALKNPLDLGRGRLIPTTSTDEYFAELALWFGASNSDLSQLLPNINRFYNPQTGTNPIGFLNIG